ncbi:MAG: hypothetical protein ACXWCN_03965 [Caldimonas sp.]
MQQDDATPRVRPGRIEVRDGPRSKRLLTQEDARREQDFDAPGRDQLGEGWPIRRTRFVRAAQSPELESEDAGIDADEGQRAGDDPERMPKAQGMDGPRRHRNDQPENDQLLETRQHVVVRENRSRQYLRDKRKGPPSYDGGPFK